MEKKVLGAHVLAIITVMIWGLTFVSTKYLLETFTPIEILFIRFFIGYIALLLFSFHHQRMKFDIRKEILFAGAGLCGVTLYFLFENIALTYTLASNVGIIVSVSPLFTAILVSILRIGETLKINFVIGFVIALAGICLVIFNGSYTLQLNPAGDMLAVLAAAVWAVYSILIKKLDGQGYSVAYTTRKVFFYGLILMIPAILMMDFQISMADFTAINTFNILFLGLGASALCFATWNYAVGVLGAIRVSVYIYLVPAATIIASIIILHEQVTWLAYAGTGLILLGLYLSEDRRMLSKQKKRVERSRSTVKPCQ